MGLVDNTLQTESTRVVSLSNCSYSAGKSGRMLMENGHCDLPTGLPKYKRRRISAFRKFPTGCGRFALRISSRPNEEAVCVGKVENSVDREKNCDAFGDVTVLGSQCSSVLESLDPTTMLRPTNDEESKAEAPLISSDQADGLNSVNVTPAKLPLLGGPDDLNYAGDIDHLVKPSGYEIVGLTKDLTKADANYRVDHMDPRKYPPRRIISAVRDFPPHCGRNAPRFVKESANILAITENKCLGEEQSVIEEEQMKQGLKTDEQVGDSVPNGDALKYRLERNVPTLTGVHVQAGFEGPDAEDSRKKAEFGACSENEMNLTQQDILEQGIKSPGKSIQNQSDLNIEAVPESDKRYIGGLEDNMGMDYMEKKNMKRKIVEYIEGSELKLFEDVVVGLMASVNNPWKQGKMSRKPTKLAGGTDEDKGKKKAIILQEQSKAAVRTMKNDVQDFGGTCMKKKKKKNSSLSSNAYKGTIQMAEWDTEDNLGHGGESDDFQLVKRSHNFDVTLPPSCPSSLSGIGHDNDALVTRNKVRETLRLFQVVYRKLVKKEETKLKNIKRPDLVAATVLKQKGKYVNTKGKIIGSVPGVEVGDEFQYRVELNIIGLHRQTQGGIDFVKEGGRPICTSIVASGGYDDNMDDSDVLTYTGSGGMKTGEREPEDQKLERGNLALRNSIEAKNPVRVIRGDTRVSESSSARTKTYVYDGLYLVEKYWQEMGPHGKLVYKFRLVRIPGQPELAWKVVKKSKKYKVREGVCVDDISEGRELIPICAVNTIDDEKPPPFEYITRVIYPDWCRPIPPVGCVCINGCSETGNCPCVAKNGGEIPYNHNGAIVEAKPMVYECGPSCKCPPSCYNRVSQHGIKFQLEIFKTESRGWGVRSLNSIPSGSFICEYVGELLEEKEAEQRTGNDEYLFDIGNNNDNSLWDGLSNLISDTQSSSCEVVKESCFTIDAAKYGNIGRFINHSCSPNLYAQNILYDHEDKRIPHIMLFAAENIPPLQELTYHYNYIIGQVLDSDGNVRKKSCYCGSSECTGRMY
ncbi:hypothetical protein JCGZ_03479 [Jatropha curcas]|uniref:Histone-lysine N-methyltransferase n=2 Tax=Jatropha curcas TaxID=180498 RepID=A0A067KY84_JATCU|nr:histone-lysine N-methyltransferase, H3 lysine-9 specific SUVH6 isoform X2 [Jatropha curcas]KDP39948.1 hypothetical protein JCGZ_03479 [Jatropha curcas]